MLAPSKEKSLYGEKRNYPIPCVSAFIQNEKGEALITERSKKVFFPGLWCLPGGHVNGGEDWVQTLFSEVEEEVGLEVVSYQLVGIYSDPALNVLEEPTTGEKKAFANVLFKVSAFKGEVTPNDEVSNWGWFSKEKLPLPMIECERVKTVDGFQFNGQVFVR